MMKIFKHKQFISILLMLSMLFTVFPQSVFSANSNSDIYEAENAVLSGSGVSVRNDSDASGGKVVGQFNNSNSKVTFSVTLDESNYYDIIVNSKGIGSDKINNLEVNNSKVGTFTSINNVYSEYTVSQVYLHEGENSIAITKSWGYIYLDYIKVVRNDINTASKYEVSKELINPNATDSAKRLMSFICDNYGKNVISGQNCDDGINGSEFKAIKNATGKTPAMLGMDLMRYTPCRVARGDKSYTVERAIEFSNAGGIVEIHWHWNAPDSYLKSGTDDNGNPRWWGGFYTSNTDFDIEKVMNGQDINGYNTLISDIDAIAVQLKRLQSADVPVLFRPLHEASGGWFWWGAKGADAYLDLWKLLYDRLTNYHGLNNLIWVWNGQSASWYPGDNYCDIVGEDIYPGTHQYAPQSTKFLEVSNYSDENKVVALTENGCLFDIDQALDAGT
ncbi:MAG: hypothetical protein K2F81_07115, partial [Ruminococcus sp.]|nr:hypothetical protein [Ruminococcus sp.]